MRRKSKRTIRYLLNRNCQIFVELICICHRISYINEWDGTTGIIKEYMYVGRTCLAYISRHMWQRIDCRWIIFRTCRMGELTLSLLNHYWYIVLLLHLLFKIQVGNVYVSEPANHIMYIFDSITFHTHQQALVHRTNQRVTCPKQNLKPKLHGVHCMRILSVIICKTTNYAFSYHFDM